jgi:hypothetical protein
VRIPEAAERRHVSARLGHNGLRVAVAGWGSWQRRLQQRVVTWADKHTSRAHIDLASSTWLLSRDAAGRRCVQFVLNEWMEGASKNDEADVRRQLDAQGNRLLLEDADPLHMCESTPAPGRAPPPPPPPSFCPSARPFVLTLTSAPPPSPWPRPSSDCPPHPNQVRAARGGDVPHCRPGLQAAQ